MRSKYFFYNLAGFVFEYFCDSRRILTTFAKFCLNSLFVTWSFRLTRHPARARSSSPPSPTQDFWRKKFLQNPSPSPSCYPQILLNASGISSRHVVFVRRLDDLVSAKKQLRTGGGVCKVLLCRKSMCGRWRGAWARAGWRVWDLGNGTIMLQKFFNPEWRITSKSFLLSSFLISFSSHQSRKFPGKNSSLKKVCRRKLRKFSKRGLDRSQMEQPIKTINFS